MRQYIFPRLTDEKQFEHLVADCYRASFPLAQVDEYGRRGQKQYGIDITVQTGSQLWCIQCKNYEIISVSDIEKILKECTYYKVNPFSKLIIATAASNDTKVLDCVIKARKNNGFPFDVEFLSWEEIYNLIENNPQVYQKYYGSLQQTNTLKDAFLEIVKQNKIADFLRIDPIVEGLASDIPPTLDCCVEELERLLDDYIERNNDALYLMIERFMNWLSTYNGNLSLILFPDARNCSKFRYHPPIYGIDTAREEKEQLILQYRTELTKLLHEIAAYAG